jgi:hypothetical protein
MSWLGDDVLYRSHISCIVILNMNYEYSVYERASWLPFRSSERHQWNRHIPDYFSMTEREIRGLQAFRLSLYKVYHSAEPTVVSRSLEAVESAQWCVWERRSVRLVDDVMTRRIC